VIVVPTSAHTPNPVQLASFEGITIVSKESRFMVITPTPQQTLSLFPVFEQVAEDSARLLRASAERAASGVEDVPVEWQIKRNYRPTRADDFEVVGRQGELRNATYILPLIFRETATPLPCPEGYRTCDFLMTSCYGRELFVEYKTNTYPSWGFDNLLVQVSKFINKARGDVPESCPEIHVDLWIVQDCPDGVFVMKYHRDDFFGENAFPRQIILERAGQECFVIPLRHWHKVASWAKCEQESARQY
jgi:hypothetical protein